MRALLRCAALAAAAGLILSCSSASPLVGKRYALVYGITRYLGGTADRVASDSTDFPAGVKPNLAFPAADAVDVAAMLTARGFDEVRLRYVDYDGNAYLDGASNPAYAPTRDTLATIDLPHFASALGPEDTFVFYYSGHGDQDAQQVNEYIALYGCLYSAFPGVLVRDPSKLVSQNDLASMLDTLPTPRKVVVLDSCYSGGFIGNTLEVDRIPGKFIGVTDAISPQVIAQAIANYAGFSTAAPDGISPYGNTIVISAAGADEFSFEWPTFPDGSPLNHGVMTYFFLKAPSYADLDANGVITTIELYSFIKAGIYQDWNTGETPFSPHISGGPVDWVLF